MDSYLAAWLGGGIAFIGLIGALLVFRQTGALLTKLLVLFFVGVGVAVACGALRGHTQSVLASKLRRAEVGSYGSVAAGVLVGFRPLSDSRNWPLSLRLVAHTEGKRRRRIDARSTDVRLQALDPVLVDNRTILQLICLERGNPPGLLK